MNLINEIKSVLEDEDISSELFGEDHLRFKDNISLSELNILLYSLEGYNIEFIGIEELTYH